MGQCPYFSQSPDMSDRYCVYHFDQSCQHPDLSFEEMDQHENAGHCFDLKDPQP
jgi:hypothetical protein